MPHVACQTDDLSDVIPNLIKDAMYYESKYNDTLMYAYALVCCVNILYNHRGVAYACDRVS